MSKKYRYVEDRHQVRRLLFVKETKTQIVCNFEYNTSHLYRFNKKDGFLRGGDMFSMLRLIDFEAFKLKTNKYIEEEVNKYNDELEEIQKCIAKLKSEIVTEDEDE